MCWADDNGGSRKTLEDCQITCSCSIDLLSSFRRDGVSRPINQAQRGDLFLPSLCSRRLYDCEGLAQFVAEPDPFASLALRIKDVPIWIFHGDKDETVPLEQSRQLVAALKKAGADVRYTEYPGADHVGGLQKAFAETDMVTWLFKQHR